MKTILLRKIKKTLHRSVGELQCVHFRVACVAENSCWSICMFMGAYGFYIVERGAYLIKFEEISLLIVIWGSNSVLIYLLRVRC